MRFPTRAQQYRFISTWLLVLLISAFGSRVSAQAIYGSLVGVITDQSGAVVPGATIQATETQTGQVRHETADGSGRYSLLNLAPGSYTVAVTSSGFRSFEQTSVGVTPNTVTRVDVHLEVGRASEQVTVNAEATILQTDKADTHTEITGKAVTDLPLGGTRNYQSLIDLTPGAAPGAFINSITDTPGHPNATNINGGNAQTNITQIDGAESINVWLPQYSGYVVPAETVEEVNVTTSAADASQGLAGSSAITVVTKSGTNQIHGSAFEFHNDQHLNARNFFLVGAKPVGIYNNYGGTIGGAIVKNKLFYFFSYDATKQKTGANGTFTVPTADQRAGNFSAYNTAIFDPRTGNLDGTGRTLFAGGIVPTSAISPIALKIQGYYPTANLAGTGSNYGIPGGPILDRAQIDTKVNWNRNEKHSIYFKYDHMGALAGGQGAFGAAGGPGVGADPGLGHTHINVGAIGHTYVFSPNLVLQGTLGYQRMVQDVKGNDYGTNYGSVLGIPGLNGADIRDSGFPDITITGYSQFGVPNWMPLFRTDETYSHSDGLTWTKGAHEIKFGFDVVRHHLNHWQPELSNGGPRGLLDFNGNSTVVKGGAAPNQYNAYAQFLLGYSDNVDKGEQYILMTGREWQMGGYVQDRWQVSQKLTVTLGVRYEFYPLMTRAGTGIESYDPATNQVYMGGRGNVPEDAGLSVSHKLFAPRGGIAYRLDDKTVIRTGYGLNYDPLPFSRPLRGFYPLTIDQNTLGVNTYAPASTLAAGIPPIVEPSLATGILFLPPTATERAPLRNSEIHRGYVQSWNFTIERKLPWDLVTSIGYVGQHSVHLLADQNINYGQPGLGQAGLVQNAQFGRTAATSLWDGYLSSNYHSLQVAVNKSLSHGVFLKGAYTWSKAIDYTDADGWASVGYNTPSQFQRNRATAGFDREHVLQLGWMYELPFGKGQAFAKNGIPAKMLGGWQLSGREAMYTGTPFTVGASASSVNDGGTNTQTANQIAPIVFLGQAGAGTTYYSPSSFAAVTAVAYGNTGRNILRNPGVWNTDMSLARNFSVTERFKLRFTAEAYNLPNTSHFNAVASSTVGNANFLRINSSYGERNFRLALRAAW